MGLGHKRSDSDAEADRIVKRRRCFTIPKDQLKLLDKDQSWVSGIQGVTQSIASNHLPLHVIESVAALYLRNEAAKKDGQKDASTSPKLPRLASERSPRSTKDVSRPRSPTPASSPEHSIEWSPSPPSQRRQRDREVPITEARNSKATSSPKFVTQPTTAHRLVTPDADLSSSSDDGQEEDLEVEIPEAATTSTPLVGLPSLKEPSRGTSRTDAFPITNNTPPCAQPPPPPVIPSTMVAADQTFARPRRRKMRPINFDDIEDNEPRIRATYSASGVRMPTTKVFKAIDSSGTKVSSSCVPATMQEPQTPSSEMSPSKPPLSGNVTTDHISSASADPNTSTNSEHTNDAEAAPAELSTFSGRQVLNTNKSNNSDDANRAKEVSTISKAPLVEGRDPYQHFTTIYPWYGTKDKGNRSLFIRACISLEYLRENLALKSVLYDDFVGAFSDGYIDYVRGAKPDQEPLPALEWYNNQDTDVFYNRRVLNIHNLELVRAAYTEEYVRSKSLFHKALEEQKEIRNEFLRTQMPQKQALEKESSVDVITRPSQRDLADGADAEAAMAKIDVSETSNTIAPSHRTPKPAAPSQRKSRKEAVVETGATKMSSDRPQGARVVKQPVQGLSTPVPQHSRESTSDLRKESRAATIHPRIGSPQVANNAQSRPCPVFMPPPPISSSLEASSPAEVRMLGEARDAGNRQHVASHGDGRHSRSSLQTKEFGKSSEAATGQRAASVSGRSAGHRSTSPPVFLASDSPSHTPESVASGGEPKHASAAPSARLQAVKPGPPPSSSLRSVTSSAVPSSSARRPYSSGMTYLQQLQAGNTDSALQKRLREKARERRMSGRESVASGTSAK